MAAEQIGGTIYLVQPNTLLASLFALCLHALRLSGGRRIQRDLFLLQGALLAWKLLLPVASKQEGGGDCSLCWTLNRCLFCVYNVHHHHRNLARAV